MLLQNAPSSMPAGVLDTTQRSSSRMHVHVVDLLSFIERKREIKGNDPAGNYMFKVNV